METKNEPIIQDVECSGCDRCEVLRFNQVQDLIYKDDILKELGWIKSYGYYYCIQCASKGTVR